MDRFWSKVFIGDTDECWPWTASVRPNGYGQFKLDGHMVLAHRTAWTFANGEIPKDNSYHGTCVLHKCDNRSCCNPAHLFLGSQKDNIHDMISKGRGCLKNAEVVPGQKLDEMDVKFIRYWLDHGYRQWEIADAFGVTQSHISLIKNREVWNG